MRTLLLSIIVLFSLCLTAQPTPKHLLKARELSDLAQINVQGQKGKFFTRSAPFQLDSFNVWMWNISENEWDLFLRSVYTYNAEGLPETITQVLVQSGSEINIGLDSLFYDNEGRIILTQRYQWNGIGWDLFSRETTTYGQDSQQFIVQIWNGANWANQFKIDFEFDANGVPLSETSSSWGGSDWDLSSRRIYSFNIEGQGDTILMQNYDQNMWVDDQRLTYTYDSQNRILSDLQERYVNGQWENVFQTNYSYNNNIQTGISQEWILDQWEVVYKTDILQDGDHAIYLTNSSWDGLEWLRSDSIHFYYSDLSAVDQHVGGNHLVSVYPNPVQDVLTFESASITANISSVEIITSTGERIYTTKASSANKYEVNVSNLSPGLYFALIKSGHRMSVVKFMKS